jgi:hypothetical protein
MTPAATSYNCTRLRATFLEALSFREGIGQSRMMLKPSGTIRIAGIILAYVLTFAGIIFGLPYLFSLSRSWIIGILLLVTFIPLFPAMQTILMGKRPASLTMLFKIYISEYASLMIQLLFLLVSVPFVIISVAGWLAIALTAGAFIAWIIVGLQQIGLEIGRKMPGDDIFILFLVTIGLFLIVGIFYWLHSFAKKREEGYFDIWAKQFVRIRKFLRY